MPDSHFDRFDHCRLTRRYFYRLGAIGAAAWKASPLAASGAAGQQELRQAIARLQYFTPVEEIRTVLDKGKAGVLQFSPGQVRAAGLSPETWTLEIGADAGGGSAIEAPVTLDWRGLMALAEKHAARFPHVCVCANGDDPFHMTMWEGVPLRELVWLTKPKGAIRRIRYESYHPPEAPPFQASLPLSQVLETPPGQAPVMLAYKMNGRIIPANKGGPARMIVPGAYGGKLIKWVRRIALTNDYRSTDSDAELNNDTESPLKTRARFIQVPAEVPAGRPAAITGYAQVGVSGLAKVQYCIRSRTESGQAEDPELTRADWKDAAILPPPAGWETAGAGSGKPREWPLRYTIAHWAALIQPPAPGAYELACRTIDGNGIAQPMPRPFLRSGVTAIHRRTLIVKG